MLKKFLFILNFNYLFFKLAIFTGKQTIFFIKGWHFDNKQTWFSDACRILDFHLTQASVEQKIATESY